MKYLLLVSLFVCSACVVIDNEEPDPGFVRCGDDDYAVLCQPGTHCSSPRIASCQIGCISDANCLEKESCIKNDEDDRVGDCVPAKPDRCCGK